MLYLLPLVVALSSCQYLPQIAKEIETIETDTAIRLEVSRETLQKETDLEISINVQNGK